MMNQPALSGPAVDALKHDRDRFVAFAFAASDVLIELDEHHHIRYIDGATQQFLGEPNQEFIGIEFSNLLADGQYDKWRAILAEVKELGRAQQRTLVFSSPVFFYLPAMISVVALPEHDFPLFISLTILRSELDETELAARDMPTGLLNREEYAKRASQRMRELTEEGIETKMSLIDLPDLKDFLDALEPNQAKELTHEISSYLRTQSVDQDMVGLVEEGVYSFVHDDSVASDEVVKEVKSLLTRLDPNIQDFRSRLSTLEGNLGDLNDEDSARAILYTLNQFADTEDNLSFESLQDGYDAMLHETVERISSFKDTVEEDSFELAFQPIVDLRNGIIHHYEALVRFDDDTFGNPFEFITFGEQTGLIDDFDLAMCRRALEVLDRCHEDSRWPLIAINLSGRSLSSQIFMDAMLGMLEKFPHIRKQLILEVTESAKISDMERANRFIQEMRKRGNICCLDDFGVAESSFDYLRYLHVDYIKIDGSYVRENLNTTRGRHLLRAMVGMCRNLGMTTIAEMVEDKKTASTLWESGVHYGQGWLFGKPDTDESTLKGWNQICENFNGMMRRKDEPEES